MKQVIKIINIKASNFTVTDNNSHFMFPCVFPMSFKFKILIVVVRENMMEVEPTVDLSESLNGMIGTDQVDEIHPVWDNEDYKIWKKNSRYLYDILATEEMEWPSLTVEWENDSLNDSLIPKLVLGTQSTETNFVMVMELKNIPSANASNVNSEVAKKEYNHALGEVGSYGGASGLQLLPKVKMVHEGEVNSARLCPNNKFLIATTSSSGEILVFDYSKHPSKPKENDLVSKPQYRCVGHTEEGFALCWDPHSPRRLLSGANDGKVCLFDLSKHEGAKIDNTIKATPDKESSSHTGAVNDVDWHPNYAHLFASASDDGSVRLWDPRENLQVRSNNTEAHSGKTVNCVAFNKFNEYLLATGGADGTVALWDARNMNQVVKRLNVPNQSKEEVIHLRWARMSENETVLASSTTSGKVHVWDIRNIGNDVNESREAGTHTEAAPELIFTHAGHVGEVNDLSWQPSEDGWMMASVDSNNYIQFWKITEQFRKVG